MKEQNEAKRLHEIDDLLLKNKADTKLLEEKGKILLNSGELKKALECLDDAPIENSKISELKKKIVSEIDADKLSATDPEHKKMQDFLDWAKRHEVSCDKIKIRHYGKGNRGVHARKLITKDEVIVAVPLTLILSSSKAVENSPLVQKVQDSGVKIDYPYCTYIGSLFSDPNQTLSFLLYFRIFPEDVSSFPFFFSEEEKEGLSGTSVYPLMSKEYNLWEAEYDRIVKAVPEYSSISFCKYLKYAVLLCSRNFYCSNAPDQRLIVPVADMFNHLMDKPQQTTWYYDSEREQFIVKALTNIEVGEEIGVYYGSKPSARFLHYYGFLPETNPFETVQIEIHLDPNDSLLLQKQKLLKLESTEIRTLPFFPLSEYICYQNDKVMAYMRYLAFSEDVKLLPKMLKPKTNGKFRIVKTPISLENERKALTLLAAIAEQHLTELSELDCEKKEVKGNWINIVKLRRIEREGYSTIKKVVDRALTLLSSPREEVAQEAGQIPSHMWLKKYTETIILKLLP